VTFFAEPLAVMDGGISRAGVPSEVGKWFISDINSGELKSWLTSSIGPVDVPDIWADFTEDGFDLFDEFLMSRLGAFASLSSIGLKDLV